jgi:exodeoxyribonuclease-1
VPLNTLDKESAIRLNIDLDLCLSHRELILQHIVEFAKKTTTVFQQSDFPETSDPDAQLYSGGFFSREDSQRIDTIRETPIAKLAELHFNFDDSRLDEMLFRYRARNYIETLNANERQRWNDYRHEKFNNPAVSQRTINQFFAEIEAIQQAEDTIGSQLVLLEALIEYANSLIQ